jgi:hypothetical protein
MTGKGSESGVYDPYFIFHAIWFGSPWPIPMVQVASQSGQLSATNRAFLSQRVAMPAVSKLFQKADNDKCPVECEGDIQYLRCVGATPWWDEPLVAANP